VAQHAPHEGVRGLGAWSQWHNNKTRLAAAMQIVLRRLKKKNSIDEQQQSRKCISISQENGLGNKVRQML